MRFHVKPRCVPADAAARRLGISPTAFLNALPEFERNGFPRPDPVSGNYDLEAIDRYIEARNPSMFARVDAAGAITDPAVIFERISGLGKGRG